MQAHHVRSALLLGMSVATSHVAQAQAQTQPLTLPAVEVTGSRIKQPADEGASPVQTLTREDIRRTGATTLYELFTSFGSVGYGSADTGGRGTFAPGSSSVSLRGFGKATLVLLNSRRVAPYPLAEYSDIFVNIDALPLEAVERVEILRSGASAIYGSEAIAGVVNIITRQDYEGVYARTSRQQSLFSHSFGSSNSSITAGFGDLASDRFNLLMNVEAFHRDRVVWSDVLNYVNPALTANFPSFGSFSSYGYPGTVIGAGPLAGCPPQLIINGLCRYNRYLRFETTPAADRLNFMGSGRIQLRPDLLGFGELLYSQTKTSYLSPFLPYGLQLQPVVWGDPTSLATRTFTYRGLPAGHPLNPTGKDDAELRYRFIDGPNESSGEAQQYRVLAGLRGAWNGFEWESAAGVMGGSAHLKLRGSFSDSGFRKVIGNYEPGQVDSQFFNRDYKIGQPNSQAVIDTLFPQYSYKGSTQQIFIDSKLTGEAGRYDGRPVGLALGFDVRHDRFAMTPSENLRTGDIVGEGFLTSSAARTHGAVFGEVNWPVTPSFDVQAAARLDKFPAFNAHVSPKVGLRFEAHPSLVFRGTAEGGFRAPNLSESAPSTRFGFESGFTDPKRCSAAQALSKDLLAAAALLNKTDPQRLLLEARADNAVNAECHTSVTTQTQNNPNLKPETSVSANLGLVFKPGRDTNIALDYWRIVRKNEIGQKGVVSLLDIEDTLPAGTIIRLDSRQDRNFSPAERAKYSVSAGPLAEVIGRFDNEAKTSASGVDLTAASRWRTPAGMLDLQFTGNYLLSNYFWYAARDGYGDNLVGHAGYPRLRADISGTLTTGPFTQALTWRYAAGTTLQGDYFDTTYSPDNCPKATGWSPEQCRYGRTHWFDYYLAYKLANLTVSANVHNLFNRRPPVSLRSIAVGGGGLIPQDVSDVMGRMLRVAVEYRFR